MSCNCQAFPGLCGVPQVARPQKLFLSLRVLLAVEIGVPHPHADLVPFAQPLLKILVDSYDLAACEFLLAKPKTKTGAQHIEGVRVLRFAFLQLLQ